MAVVATKAAFLALARVSVVVNKSFHLHRRTAAQPRTIQPVAAARAIIVPDDLVKIAPKIGVSGALLIVIGMWSRSFPG